MARFKNCLKSNFFIDRANELMDGCSNIPPRNMNILPKLSAILLLTFATGLPALHASTLPFVTTFSSDPVGSLPSGWSQDLAQAPAVSSAFGASGDVKSTLFSAGNQGMRATFATTSDIQWDFWIRPTGTGRSVTVGTYDSSNRYGIWLSFGVTAGSVSYYANGMWTAVPGVTFAAGKWYRVRVVGRVGPDKSFDFFMSNGTDSVLPDRAQGRRLPLRDQTTSGFAAAHLGTYSFSSSAYMDDSVLQVPLADGFEGNSAGVLLPAGWTSAGSSNPEINASGADGSQKSLRIFQTTNRIEKSFEPADEVCVDFKVYPEGTGRSVTMSLMDETRKFGPYLSFGVSAGKASYYANDQWTTLSSPTLTAGSWHRVRVVVRLLPSPSFDLYIGNAGQDSLPALPQASNLPFRDPSVVNLSSVALDGVGLASAAKVDNVEIVQGLDPLPPVPTTPSDQLVYRLPSPSFFWEGSPSADSFEMQIAADSSFSNVIDSDTIAINRYVNAQPLSPGTYYWRVRARGTGGLASEYGPIRQLTILAPTNVYSIPADADAATIQNTIANAVTPAVVNFASGTTYTLSPSASYLIALGNKSDLIINGNGANLVFTNPMVGLASFSNCQRLIMRDLTVDFNPVPFSVGTIVSSQSNGEFVVDVDSGMPAFNAAHMVANWTWGVLLDPAVPGKLKDGAPLVVDTSKTYGAQLVSGYTNRFRLKLADPSNSIHFTANTKYIQFARDPGGKSLVTFSGGNSVDVTCLNITNYAISGGHYICTDGSDYKILNCKALIKSGRWFGGNADGVHVRYNGVGPWVEGCEFNGIGDDSVALYSKGVFIQQKLSNSSLRLGTDYFTLTVGSRFTIFNPREGTAVAENRKVLSVTAVGSPVTAWDVTFEPSVTAAIQTSDPDPLKNDQVFDSTRVSSQFALRNNTFKNVRRFGSIIRASYGVIEGNTYENISDIPIVFRNEPDHWRNGLNSSDIRVQNNVIRNSGFSASAQNKGQIELMLAKLGSSTLLNTFGAWRGHRRMVIEGNEIWNWQERGIVISNAGKILVSKNKISADAGVTFNNSRNHYGIEVDNTEDLQLLGNNITDPRPMTQGISVSTNVSGIVIEEP